jgi:hypothetical protein
MNNMATKDSPSDRAGSPIDTTPAISTNVKI